MNLDDLIVDLLILLFGLWLIGFWGYQGVMWVIEKLIGLFY